MMEKVLGIDGSTTTTGYAICRHYKDKRKRIESFGDIKAKEKFKALHKSGNQKVTPEELRWRSEYTINMLVEIIETGKFDRVVIEDTYASKDPKAYKWLCRIQGAVIGKCLEKNIPVTLVMPSKWRKFCGIKQRDGKKALKRKELKTNDVNYVNKEFGLNLQYKENDKANAICLAMYE